MGRSVSVEFGLKVNRSTGRSGVENVTIPVDEAGALSFTQLLPTKRLEENARFLGRRGG
jgi:hypothetical protein